MSNFNKSEHFWGSKKAFEILANLGLEPLPEGGGGVQGDQAGIDKKENLGGCDVFYGASLDPQLSFTIVYVNFTAMNKTFSKHQ